MGPSEVKLALAAGVLVVGSALLAVGSETVLTGPAARQMSSAEHLPTPDPARPLPLPRRRSPSPPDADRAPDQAGTERPDRAAPPDQGRGDGTASPPVPVPTAAGPGRPPTPLGPTPGPAAPSAAPPGPGPVSVTRQPVPLASADLPGDPLPGPLPVPVATRPLALDGTHVLVGGGGAGHGWSTEAVGELTGSLGPGTYALVVVGHCPPGPGAEPAPVSCRRRLEVHVTTPGGSFLLSSAEVQASERELFELTLSGGTGAYLGAQGSATGQLASSETLQVRGELTVHGGADPSS